MMGLSRGAAEMEVRWKISWIFWWMFSFGLLCEIVLSATNPGDTQALRAIKAGLVDTSSRLSNWQGDDPCGSGDFGAKDTWLGVYCVKSDYPSSLAASNFSHVTELRLFQLSLRGELSSALGSLPALKYLNVMWNQISGTIPSSLGNLTNLNFLLLSGNQLTGELPPELSFLPNLKRLHIDENMLSGKIPNLPTVQFMYMNNNSLNGSIETMVANLTTARELLLDNNHFTGALPGSLAAMPNLSVLQLDNNMFDAGPVIPQEYGRASQLAKLSLRNCNLGGSIPGFGLPSQLKFLDLSHNSLTGSIPDTPFSGNLTAMDLSYNLLTGSIPSNVATISALQFLALRRNNISGLVPANLGSETGFTSNKTITIVDLQNTNITGFASGSNLVNLQSQGKANVWLSGTPYCSSQTNNDPRSSLCTPSSIPALLNAGQDISPPVDQGRCEGVCSPPFVLTPSSQNSGQCACAVPFTLQCRLKSPGFGQFAPFVTEFQTFFAAGLGLNPAQVVVVDYVYQPGPRFLITVNLFPTGSQFNLAAIGQFFDILALFKIPANSLFGPWELISVQPPPDGLTSSKKSSHKLTASAIAGIAVGVLTFIVLKTLCMFYVIRYYLRRREAVWTARDDSYILSRRQSGIRRRSYSSIKVTNVKEFSFDEMAAATDDFSGARLVGEGGYGKVYSGVLVDGMKVAIKRAEESSHQGLHEFETEIQLLSRVHHRNLVSLIGYCHDVGEQMLVYEFIAYGSLEYHLSSSARIPLDFLTRLQIALGSARGIHYLHTQADPPIYHRDVKTSNILLDAKFHAKVADFGLSKTAPMPDLGGKVGHVSTVVKGTPGYLDPEYFKTHRLTEKSDVYSFGVVLLVLISGMQPISDGKNLVREVVQALDDGEMAKIVDFRIRTSYPRQALDRLVKLALVCCRDAPVERPTISEVLTELEQLWTETYDRDVDVDFEDSDSTSYSGDLRTDMSHSQDSFIEINPSISSSAVSSSSAFTTSSNVESDPSRLTSKDHISPR